MTLTVSAPVTVRGRLQKTAATIVGFALTVIYVTAVKAITYVARRKPA